MQTILRELRLLQCRSNSHIIDKNKPMAQIKVKHTGSKTQMKKKPKQGC